MKAGPSTVFFVSVIALVASAEFCTFIRRYMFDSLVEFVYLGKKLSSASGIVYL